MARNGDIRYIQYYADGSAARQFELPLQPKKQSPQPRRRKQKKTVLHVDFVAMAGILVAVVMLILMMVGVSELIAANEEVAKLESYVDQLEHERTQLQNTYRESYDLEDVRTEALKMGLISAQQAQTVTVRAEPISVAEAPAEHSLWTFLTGLFA